MSLHHNAQTSSWAYRVSSRREALTLPLRAKTGARRGLLLSTSVEFKSHWNFAQVSVAFQCVVIRHKYL